MNKFFRLSFAACLVVMASHARADAPAVVQDNYDLVYNDTDGSLTIVTTGNLISYVLESESDAFTGANHALTISLEEVAPGSLIQTGSSSSTNSQLFEFSSLDLLNRVGGREPYGAGSYNIGNVLPIGLDLAGVQGAINKVNTYTEDVGVTSRPFDIIVVPEPTSLTLLGLGGLLIARRRC